MKSRNTKASTNKSRRRYSIRLLLLLCVALCFACSQNQEPSYEVIGRVDLSNREQIYSFTDTLNALYTPNGQIIVGQVTNVYGAQAEISVDEVVLGTLSEADSLLVNWQASDDAPKQALSVGSHYLFFMLSGENSYTLQQDENGWLMVENGRVISQRSGGSVSLETVYFESARIGNAVALPTNFYRYWDLSPLVAGCDSIFLGTVRSIREASYTYYFNDSDIRLNLSDDTHVYQLEVLDVYHGNLSIGENVQVLSAPTMMKNTVDYTSLQPTESKYSDAPPMYADATYVFFIIDSPVSDLRSTNFFVNPVQGAVPVSTFDQVTYSVPSNPIFVSEYYLEDLAYDIRAEVFYQESQAN